MSPMIYILLRFHTGNELQAMKGRPTDGEKEKSLLTGIDVVVVRY